MNEQVEKSNPSQAEYFKDIVGTLREPLLVLDASLRVLAANRSFYKTFKVKQKETVGTLVYELGNRQWDIPALRTLLESILPGKSVFNDYEVEYVFPFIGKRSLLLNARRIPAPPKKATWILLAFEDVTERMQQERSLRASEQRFRRAFETAHDGMLLIEKTGGMILNSNQSAEDMLGYSKTSLQKKRLWEVGILKDEGHFRQTALELEEQGEAGLPGINIPTRRGGDFPADVFLTNRAAVIQCNIRDIRARQQAEEKLATSENELRALFAAMTDVVFVLDGAGRYLSIAPTNPANLFRPSQDLLGKTIHQVFPKQPADYMLAKIKESIQTKQSVPGEYALQIDGKETWFESSITRLSENSVIWVAHEITERKRVEKALQTSQSRFRAIFEQAAIGVAQIDSRTGEFVMVNQKYCDIFGYTSDELLHKRFQEISHMDDLPLDLEMMHKLIAGEIRSFEMEKRHYRSDQSIVWLNLTVSPMWAPGEPPDYHVAVVEDITPRKQAEQALRASEERYRMLMDTIPDGVIVHSLGRIIYANPGSAKIGGAASPAELIGKPVLEFVHPDFRKMVLSRIQQTMAGFPAPMAEEKFIRLDGEIIDVQVTNFQVFYADKPAILTVFGDITERAQAERLLHESEQQLQLITNNMHDMVIRTDLQGLILYASPSHAPVLGFRPENMVGTYMYELMHPEDLDRVRTYARASLQNKIPGKQEFRYRHADGHYLWLESTGVIYFDENGQPAGVVLSSHDITARKQAEEEVRQLNTTLEQRVDERTRELHQAQKELVRKEKLAVLGQLAGGVGHELRNPLGVISNSAYYLKLVQPDANEKIRKHHAMIEQQVHIATQIISDLLDYARVISTNPQPVPMRALVEHTLSRFPVPESIQVSLNIPANLPQSYADPLHVEQILGNLVTNACQAMASPSLNTKLGTVPLSGDGKLTITANRRKQMLAIAVKDTGTGITPENMQKLFEPLISTKVTGIGLGLAVSQKLAEANGGRILVESQVGQGSTFTLYLPVPEGS